MQVELKLRNRTPPQKRISESPKRFNLASWGRQSGKTTFGLDKMVFKPLQGRVGGIYWYILQTHTAAHIAFNRFLELTKNTGIITYKNESHKSVQFLNGATLFFKSGQNYEDLRAETLDGCIIDEVRQQHPDLWTKVIRPMLARNKGWCDFYSTPNGFDHFKDIYDNAVLNPNEWGVFHAPSTEAWWWTEEEIKSNQAVMTEDEFAQEILAEFREMGVGKTYKNHTQENQRMDNPFTTTGAQWSPYLPIIVGLDFNVGLMAWELCQNRGQDFYFGDEIALKNTDSIECAKELAHRVKDHKPGIILIGDASGNARNTKAEAGKTDYKIIENILRENGIKFENRTPESNPPVKDRVNCMNSALRTADGVIHLWYHPLKCKYLKGDLEKVKWKEGAESAILDKSDPLRTHSSDAAGYPVAYYSDLLKQQVGVMRVINR